VKNILVCLLVIILSGCIKAGEFSPERHAQYELGHADCEKTPERCIHGVPW